jgi:toxin ParE1/3/4
LKRRLAIAPRARADLRGIWHYTATEHGPEAADAYLRDLDKAMQLVREFRDMGSDCSEVRRGYRRIRSGSHLIYYIADQAELVVIRVLHERMDAESNLR